MKSGENPIFWIDVFLVGEFIFVDPFYHCVDSMKNHHLIQSLLSFCLFVNHHLKLKATSNLQTMISKKKYLLPLVFWLRGQNIILVFSVPKAWMLASLNQST